LFSHIKGGGGGGEMAVTAGGCRRHLRGSGGVKISAFTVEVGDAPGGR